jgi:hypothetical protein
MSVSLFAGPQNSFASHTSQRSQTAIRQFDTRVKNRSRKHEPGRLPHHGRTWQHANSTAAGHLGELSGIIGPASSQDRSFIHDHDGQSRSRAPSIAIDSIGRDDFSRANFVSTCRAARSPTAQACDRSWNNLIGLGLGAVLRSLGSTTEEGRDRRAAGFGMAGWNRCVAGSLASCTRSDRAKALATPTRGRR